MKDKSYIKGLGLFKLSQLISTILIDIAFFLVMLLNKNFRENIFESPALTFVCIFTWLALLFFLFFIFVDLIFIRQLSIETHDLNKRAYLDSLTNIPNRQSLDMLFDTHCTPKSIENMGCGMIRLSNLNTINEQISREAGDSLLQNFCKLFNEIRDTYNFVGRNSGNEFIFVIENCDDSAYQNFINMLQSQIDGFNNENNKAPIEIQMSFTMNSKEHHQKLNQLFASTSEKLHAQFTNTMQSQSLEEEKADE